MMENFAEAFEIIDEIEDSAGECCAITLDPDEIIEKCGKLRNILQIIIEENKL
jgi:hypothetical protein|tara:strand:+ start:531 stop:689 length:159 start_codon:yes stop_codon:yes gene_type:complete